MRDREDKMGKLFGTDGIRGIANIEPITVEMVVLLGRSIAHVFRNKKKRHRIVIGKDTRLSGYMLESALVAGICSMGADALLLGPLPTPGIAFITSNMRADAGVVISASHNPYQDNGIKIFGRDGFKLSDSIEGEIERLIFSNEMRDLRPTANNVGKAYRIEDAIGRYIVFLKTTFPKEFTLDGLKIVLDCANGAAYKVGPIVFEELGAEVFPLSVEPNGENINASCGALYPEVMANRVKEVGADIGIALDGDGDRVIFADENGNIIDGDHIMAICAKKMIEEGKLSNNTVVATIMSSMGLEKTLKKFGAKLVRTSVGDRYVVERMVSGGYNLGGEKSGHLIFLDYTTTGDGIITALQVLSIMVKSQKGLSELISIYEDVPQVLINVRVKEKVDMDRLPSVKKAIEEAEDTLSGFGRVIVRYSGTEPLARVMVEGDDKNLIESLAKNIAKNIEKELC